MAGQTATFVNRPKWGANYPPESVARSKRQGSINVVYIPDRISHCPTISGGTNHFAGQITRRRKADRLWAINPRKPSTSSRRRSRPKSTNQNSRSSRLCSRNNQAIKSSNDCGSRHNTQGNCRSHAFLFQSRERVSAFLFTGPPPAPQSVSFSCPSRVRHSFSDGGCLRLLRSLTGRLRGIRVYFVQFVITTSPATLPTPLAYRGYYPFTAPTSSINLGAIPFKGRIKSTSPVLMEVSGMLKSCDVGRS